MAVERPATARAFLELAGPLLERDEARHNLLYGLCSAVDHDPEQHPGARWWVTVRDGAPAAAAMRTPPHYPVLADPLDKDALEELLDAVAGDDAGVHGLLGNAPFVDTAARAWASRTGTAAEVEQAQAIHALTEVRDVARAPGRARPAAAGDRELLLRWFVAFADEALPAREDLAGQMERSLDARMDGDASGLWLWEASGVPVSTAGFLGKTPNGIRVGPVYTPPEHRGRGFATTLVADLSAWLLSRGNRFCFLYTDVGNPTSNRIYAAIGYLRVCDAVDYRFVRE